MLYRTMPKNGDQLSALGFGCMRLPMQNGAIDEKRAVSQIRYAIDKGVNYLDTAWPYHGGESEPLVGKALKDGYREKVKIATKLPTWLVNSREDMDMFLDAQLEKLQVDYIDYYLVHSLNRKAWEKMESLGIADFLDKAQADGRIVNPGFSYHGMSQDFAAIVDAYPWVFCQIQYNYLDREFQAGEKGLEYAHQKGLGVIIMEPLRGGYLGTSEPPEEVSSIWEQAHKKRSPVEWALSFVLDRPETTVVISGMNEEAHIKENIKIASKVQAGTLGERELSIIESAADKYNELLRVKCTGCGYCMPCPYDVNIPFCLDSYNNIDLSGGLAAARFKYVVGTNVMGAGRTGYASQCVSCGECLDKCPQDIAIPDFLKEAADAFEGDDFTEFRNKVVSMMTQR